MRKLFWPVLATLLYIAMGHYARQHKIPLK